jgi:hypothetical protein
MQYVLLIYQGTTPLPGSPEWEELPDGEQRAIYADYAALNKAPGVNSGPPLGLPTDATTVRVQDGATVTTDGTLVDNKEPLGGFLVLEADDVDAAIERRSEERRGRHG